MERLLTPPPGYLPARGEYVRAHARRMQGVLGVDYAVALRDLAARPRPQGESQAPYDAALASLEA